MCICFVSINIKGNSYCITRIIRGFYRIEKIGRKVHRSIRFYFRLSSIQILIDSSSIIIQITTISFTIFIIRIKPNTSTTFCICIGFSRYSIASVISQIHSSQNSTVRLHLCTIQRSKVHSRNSIVTTYCFRVACFFCPKIVKENNISFRSRLRIFYCNSMLPYC